MCDGFRSYESGAIRWKVTHNHGTSYVHAFTESIALARFMAKYPNYSVRNIEKG